MWNHYLRRELHAIEQTQSRGQEFFFDFHTQVTLAVLYAFWMPAGSAYNVDAVLEVMIDGLRAEIDERERAVDDAFAGRGDDARPGNPS